jgi:hypothetical protein
MKAVIIYTAIAALVVGISLVLIRIFRTRTSPHKYLEKWQDLQRFCASKETWPLAIITADKLLDEALKNKRIKGKSMGERLVSAQRTLTDNDGVWFSHNLAKKLIDEATVRLNQTDVKKSLLGVRQALKDLGVME